MSTLAVATIQSNTTSPPAVTNSAGTKIGTFCRAWVNFNGTGTVAIRAGFNVSSITDSGVGDYTINFATAMQDVSYGVSLGGARTGDNTLADGNRFLVTGTYSTSSLRVLGWLIQATPAAADISFFNVAIFR